MPVIVVCLAHNRCVEALWLVGMAGLTDAADGYLARRLQAVSRVGAYLDPIADKLLLTALYICFSAVNLAPKWLVYLVVGRDLMILSLAGAGLFWKGIRDFPPSIWGKASTFLQIGASIAIIARCAFAIDPAVVDAVVYTMALATFWSGIHYLWRAIASIGHGSK